MGLFDSLGLKPTAAMAARRGSAAQPKPAPASAPAKNVESAAPPPKGATAPAADPARQAALALRGDLKQREQATRTEVQRLHDFQDKLDKAIKAAAGTQKSALEAKKKLLDKHVGDAEEAFDQARADLDALDDPSADRATFVAILARAKSKVIVARETELDTHAEVLGRKPGEKHETKTTTEFADGRSVVTKEERQRSVGLDGVTQKSSKETEARSAEGRWKTGEEKTVQVGPKGVSIDEKKTFESERDGKTVTLEKGRTAEVGKDGASRGTTTTLKRSDGSSTTTGSTEAIERGEGKLGAAVGKSKTETDAAGTATGLAGKGKGGVMAGDKGYGGFAEGEGKFSKERKNGVKTGAVAGLNAHIVCHIGEPEGDEHPKYPLTLEVNLGGKLTLSAGHAKKDGPAAAGVEAKVGADVYMRVKHLLGEAEATEYVQALAEISAGGKGAANYKEFAIIHAGINEGWQVAQAMYAGGGKPLGQAMRDQLTQAGDSIEVGGSTTLGGKAKLSAKVVSVEAGVEQTNESASKVTRNQEGGLDVERSQGETTKVSGKVGIDSGIVSGAIGRSRTVRTSVGYEITIDPKNDPDGRLYDALMACANAADYETFLKAHGKQVTVTGKTVGQAASDSEEVELGVAGAKLGIGLQSGVAEERQTDGQGQLKKSRVVGSAGAGGGIEAGGFKIGDSVDEKAVAERDAQGNASLELARERSATSFDKVVKAAKAKLPFVGDDESSKEGLLSKAAGGAKETDTQSHDVAGLRLNNQDLDRIGQIACTDPSRWSSAVRRYQEIDDWKRAGNTIRAAKGERGVVAEELARFIGGDKIHRLEMVNAFLRPGGNVAIGRAYEFPESLKARRAEYDKFVDAASEEQIDKVLAKDGPVKAAELGRRIVATLDDLSAVITSAKDFAQRAAKAEMLSAINKRKTLVLAALRRVEGKNSAQDEQAAAQAEFGRLLKECVKYETMQDELFQKVRDLLGDRKTILVANGDFAKAAVHIKQLSDLIAVWNGDFGKAAEIARAIGKPETLYINYKPNLTEFQRLKKACMM